MLFRSMQDDLRGAVEADMSDKEKQAAAENKAEMAKDAEGFKAANAERVNAIAEYDAAAAQSKNSDGNSTIWFWALLIALVAGLGFVLVKKGKRN